MKHILLTDILWCTHAQRPRWYAEVSIIRACISRQHLTNTKRMGSLIFFHLITHLSDSSWSSWRDGPHVIHCDDCHIARHSSLHDAIHPLPVLGDMCVDAGTVRPSAALAPTHDTWNNILGNLKIYFHLTPILNPEMVHVVESPLAWRQGPVHVTWIIPWLMSCKVLPEYSGFTTWIPSQYKDRLPQVWGFPC